MSTYNYNYLTCVIGEMCELVWLAAHLQRNVITHTTPQHKQIQPYLEKLIQWFHLPALLSLSSLLLSISQDSLSIDYLSHDMPTLQIYFQTICTAIITKWYRSKYLYDVRIVNKILMTLLTNTTTFYIIWK
jgi:hypothetical protein